MVKQAHILPSSLSLPFRLLSIMPLGSWRLAAASWGTKGPEGTERSDRQKGRTVGIRTGWDRERGQQAETYLRDCRLSLSLRAPAVGTATARATFGHILGHAIRPLAHRRKLFLALASARGELCVTEIGRAHV